MKPGRLLLLAGPLLWVLAADLAPLLAMLRISLLDSYPPLPGQEPGNTLANYAAFLATPLYGRLFLRSFAFAGAITLLALPVAFPLAYHLAVKLPPKRRFSRLMLIVAPFWASEIVRSFAIVLLLARNGAVNLLLRHAGLTDAPLGLLYGPGSLAAGMLYAVLLSMLLPLYAALERIPPGLLDAAHDLGAGPWTRLWHVTVPQARGGIAAGCALVFLLGIGAYAVPLLLGGADTTLFSITIGGLFSGSAGRWPTGAAFSVILLAAALTSAGLLMALAAPRRVGQT